MSRWQPDARERLEQAAIALFVEQGFAATTVPQITARAGLTTRTFFRHYADKREVLFAGDEIPAMAARMMADAPPDADPMTLILDGLETVTRTRFDPRRHDLRQRRRIVRSDPALQERDLRKRAALSEAIRSGFESRGLGPTQAALLAETALTLLYVSLDEWLDADDDAPLHTYIEKTLSVLRDTIA
ncbi:TetR/AcrR family transcriptional regulator [Paractinoplanes maris]|uniref:TetR/AcrR family transcriptional regulator n=1 Tax=Paractinoplanes maris TaxID=1734446 RepID=UPI0020200A70|nr:helix-turn-helix domain-containing protein [Actinoplanes maris]